MKWIKFKEIIHTENTIFLPKILFYQESKLTELYFGSNYMKINVVLVEQNIFTFGEDFDNPIIIECSKNIIDELLIVDSLTYQIFIENNNIHIGPVIGFLLGEQYYYYHNRFLEELNEAMRIYTQIGGLFIAFKENSLNWDKKNIDGLYYNCRENRKWIYSKLPIPSTIFRRTFKREDENIKKLKEVTSGKIFNEFKLDKFQMYKKLMERPSFSKYLPDTERLNSIIIFFEYLNKHNKVILKPIGLSRGRGICIIEKIDNNFLKIYDYRQAKDKKEILINIVDVIEFLIENMFFSGEYIIQPFIKLAAIDNRIFDIRVVMQKNNKEEWQCTGFECRVANSGNKITNIAVGSEAMTIEETIELAFKGKVDPQKVKKDLEEVGKEFCLIMDDTGGLFAEFGLDIGIDAKGHYWFIEGNTRPAFKGFRKIHYKTYLDICFKPIIYAVSLTGFALENGRGSFE